MGKMSSHQNVPTLVAQPIAHPSGRVVRLQVARRGKLGERVASAPERFSRLTCAQLAAVPDDRGPRAAGRGVLRRSLHGLAALGRERAPRIDIRPDSVAVMNEKQVQPCELPEMTPGRRSHFFFPARRDPAHPVSSVGSTVLRYAGSAPGRSRRRVPRAGFRWHPKLQVAEKASNLRLEVKG